MDTDLRAYMEAMEQRAVARDAETRAVATTALQTAAAAHQEAAAAHQEAAAAYQEAAAAHQEAREGRSEARVLHEDTMRAIGTVIDGLNMLRAAVEVRADDRVRAMMDAHIAPLEASATNHERRIRALEASREP